MYHQNSHRIRNIGKYTYGYNNIEIYYWGEETWLDIGKFCSISGHVKVYLGGNHRTDWATTYPFGHINQKTFDIFGGEGHPQTKGNVIIGNDVWIGTDVTIMSGITIGDGACIASNTVVTKNVDPYNIVGGNPGKIIKKRFNDDTINQLLELKWWEFEDNFINQITPYLCNPDFQEYLPELLEIKRLNFKENV
jgi:acetyltransferase-like isoleucine patch superfamily enzyme